MTLPTPLSQGSRLVQRLHRRYPQELAWLPAGEPTAAHLHTTYALLRQTYPEVADALRVLRQLVLERLVVLDCEQQAPLNTITQSMTALAEFSLNKALEEALARVDQRHGSPMTAQGTRAQLWVVGMGKLGAGELNVSSDIDLVYVFDEDGQTQGVDNGRGVVSNHSYFDKVVKQLYALIGETTEHGQVFRMDLALRPNGESGHSVVSLDALEEYFQVQGREWERLAWLKARVVAPAACIDQVKALRAVVTPFVFRRYLDYNVFEALRVLHQQIRTQSLRLSAGRPERANDVKLGRGGIREIEFTVQLLQVVRGGQFPELRERPTLVSLAALVGARLMPADTAQALHEAYVFLRQVEHRIQYLDDQQTHRLPSDPADLQWIAHTLGLADSNALLQALQQHRDRVAQEFERLLGQGEPSQTDTANAPAPASGEAQGLPKWPTLAQWSSLRSSRSSGNPSLPGDLESAQRALLPEAGQPDPAHPRRRLRISPPCTHPIGRDRARLDCDAHEAPKQFPGELLELSSARALPRTLGRIRKPRDGSFLRLQRHLLEAPSEAPPAKARFAPIGAILRAKA